jgi:hypothetical protein
LLIKLQIWKNIYLGIELLALLHVITNETLVAMHQTEPGLFFAAGHTDNWPLPQFSEVATSVVSKPQHPG